MSEIITPAGRIVWGHPMNGRPKLDNNKQPVLDKQGQPVTQWVFGIAFSKADFTASIWPAMHAEVATLFPQGVPANFSYKYVDGDAMDANNPPRPYSDREGYAGCFVLSVSTQTFQPRVVQLQGSAYVEFTPEQIKCGDYVRIGVNFKCHQGKAGTMGSVPGIYVNPSMIEFLGYGSLIQSGPDAQQLFGGSAVALPAGASAVPIAPVGQQAAIPGQPAPQQAAIPGQPAPQQAAMPGQPAPQQAAMPGQPVAPAGNPLPGAPIAGQ